MKGLFLTLIIFLTGDLHAQTVDLQLIGSLGGSYTDATMNVNYSAGEAITQTISNGSIVLTQGFHQPDYAVNGLQDVVLNEGVKLFPNPATSDLNISFLSAKLQNEVKRVSIIDLRGEVVYSGESDELFTGEATLTLDVNALTRGSYILQIEGENSLLSRVKFVKF